MEKRLKRSEHVLDDDRWIGAVADIPINDEGTLVFEHLAVQVNLWSLADAVAGGRFRHETTSSPLGTTCTQLGCAGEPERAGEHDGHERGLGPVTATEFTQDLDAREHSMVEVVGELILHGHGPLDVGRSRMIHGQGDHRGEIAYDSIDIRMQGQAPLQGDIEREPVVS